MINYSAPNPYPEKKPGIIANFFASFFSSSSTTSIGKILGKVILPAQWELPHTLSQQTLEKASYYRALTIDGGYIATHDGAVLDTIALMPDKDRDKLPQEKHFIIKFNGNGMQYQDVIEKYANDADSLQATVIGFNYRGVGHSKKAPETFQDLITDGIAQVQRLLDQGANPEHILLDGVSLGGSVATMVAQHFHQRKQCVYLWNDRSFASLTATVAQLFTPELPGILKDTIEASLESTSWSIMVPTGWDVNVAAAYRDIPEKYKGYMVVAKASEKSAGDGVIPHQASLHKSVRTSEKQSGVITGHKVFAPLKYNGGHNVFRNYLISKEHPEQTGQDLFTNFANKLGK